MTDPHASEAPFDYDGSMRANLARVFNERDAERRTAAIRELYTEDAVLYEPDAIVTGRAAIHDAVAALLSSLPPEFVFTATAPAVGHHGLARLDWRCGPPNGPVAITGTDVARFERGLIHSLHVLLDPTTR